MKYFIMTKKLNIRKNTHLCERRAQTVSLKLIISCTRHNPCYKDRKNNQVIYFILYYRFTKTVLLNFFCLNIIKLQKEFVHIL